jgi:polysaccharide biosynthesis/export protein VpsN
MRRPVYILLPLVLAAILGGAFVGCGPGVSPEQAPSSIPPPSSQGFRVGDVVAVSLSGIMEPMQVTIAIDDQGNITLPYIGAVPVAGLTESGIAAVIRDTYLSRRIYNRIDVSVSAAQRFVHVGGQVNRPGRILWSPDLTISKAIQDAGGFTVFSGRSRVSLSRENRNYSVDVERALREPATDVKVYPGDSINVPRARF